MMPHGIAKLDAFDRLRLLVQAYCESRNLDYQAYMEGLMRRGMPSDTVVKILICNHQEWLSLQQSNLDHGHSLQ